MPLFPFRGIIICNNKLTKLLQKEKTHYSIRLGDFYTILL